MKNFEKERAILMRKRGKSIGEIAQVLHVSKSSVSLWVRDVVLSEKVKKILEEKLTSGQKKAREVHLKNTKAKEAVARTFAVNNLPKSSLLSKNSKLLSLAIFYWCEGNKSPNDLVLFTNSDPNVINTFLKLLRDVFEVDEKKFRVCIHLHEYHDVQAELQFWSKITTIALPQFFKPYRKPHSGKRFHEGYHGCAQIRYYDVGVARKLLACGKLVTEVLFV